MFSCQHSVLELRSAPKVTRQGYYARRKPAASEHALRGAELAAKMFEVYETSRRVYGSPKVFRVLKRGGERVSRKRAAGTMRENGWRGVTRRCAKNPEGESAPPRANRPPTRRSAISAQTARTGRGSPTSRTPGPIGAGCARRR